MNIDITEFERKLLVHLLKLAKNEFSNHGCGDLDLSEFEPSEDKCQELKLKIYKTFVDPDYDFEDAKSPIVEDWIVMNYLIRKLEQHE